jgi:glycosyltransferase involved in cell wall biosynthesis
MKKIEVIVPLLNEFEVIEELLLEINNLFDDFKNDNVDLGLVLVDDGSDEEFKKLLKNYKKKYDFKLIELSRNYGQQTAFKAGIQQTNADAVILMDGDLQDPPSLIPEMIEAYISGFEIVNTIRNKREKESWFKKFSASLFYKLVDNNSNINLTRNSGDFKLISTNLIEIIKSTKENDIYLRGLVDWYGGKVLYLDYDRQPRFAGKRKYKYRQSFDLALNGLVSFSDFFPNILLKLFIGFLIIFFGITIFLFSSIISSYDNLVRGWSSIVATLLFISIIQIFGFFFMAIYLNKIFHQTSGKNNYQISNIS